MAGRAPAAPASRRSSAAAWNCGEFGSIPARQALARGASGRGSRGTRDRAGTGRPSGQTRTSAAAAAASRCCRRSRAGARRRAEPPATSASTHREPAGSTGGSVPWLSGSGKLGTPCERMQREKAERRARRDSTRWARRKWSSREVVVEPSCATPAARRAAACGDEQGQAGQPGQCGSEQQGARPTPVARRRRTWWPVAAADGLGERVHAVDDRSAR